MHPHPRGRLPELLWWFSLSGFIGGLLVAGCSWLRVSPGGSVREQIWRVLLVPAESGLVQAALGWLVSPSLPCDFTGSCRMGWMGAGVQGCVSLGSCWPHSLLSLVVLCCLRGDWHLPSFLWSWGVGFTPGSLRCSVVPVHPPCFNISSVPASSPCV